MAVANSFISQHEVGSVQLTELAEANACNRKRREKKEKKKKTAESVSSFTTLHRCSATIVVGHSVHTEVYRAAK